VRCAPSTAIGNALNLLIAQQLVRDVEQVTVT
jgi:hypothetical protein